ncbi:MAG: neocarzinostatin apoprotein domain-containing protein [Acidimicrobiales bacterium]
MIVIVVLGLVVVGLAVAGVLGAAGAFGRGRRSWLLLPLAGVGLVLVAGVGVGVVGIDGPGGRHEEPEAVPEESPVSEPASTTPLPDARAAKPLRPPAADIKSTPGDLPALMMKAARPDRFSAYQVVEGLAPDAVIRVRAGGFDWHERGTVAQCVLELGRLTTCGPSSPVQFDDGGKADFQVLVHDAISTGRCRVGRATCLLKVTGTDSRRQAVAQTVFVDRVEPGRLRVTPSHGLSDGESVEVAVTGFPAGRSALAVLCAPPGGYDARRCDPPPSSAPFVIDANGTGRTRVVVGPSRLGADGVVCGPQRPCGVAVIVGAGFVAAPVAPITFSLGPGASYQPVRLVAGLTTALALLVMALLVARRTDWTKPAEAATPGIDEADLQTGATLDDLFGTDAEIEESDPIPS